MNFKIWLEEIAGEDHTRLNSEHPLFGEKCRSKLGADACPKEPDFKRNRNKPLGFMKKRMNKK